MDVREVHLPGDGIEDTVDEPRAFGSGELPRQPQCLGDNNLRRCLAETELVDGKPENVAIHQCQPRQLPPPGVPGEKFVGLGSVIERAAKHLAGLGNGLG